MWNAIDIIIMFDMLYASHVPRLQLSDNQQHLKMEVSDNEQWEFGIEQF